MVVLAQPACVSLEPTMFKASIPEATVGHLAVNFRRDSITDGFVITITEISTGKSYNMPLGEEKHASVKTHEGISMIKLPPGRYVVENWRRYRWLTSESLGWAFVKPSTPLGQQFEIKAQKVTYLGSVLIEWQYRGSASALFITPQFHSVSKGRAMFLEKFPNFAELPFECMLCALTDLPSVPRQVTRPNT